MTNGEWRMANGEWIREQDGEWRLRKLSRVNRRTVREKLGLINTGLQAGDPRSRWTPAVSIETA